MLMIRTLLSSASAAFICLLWVCATILISIACAPSAHASEPVAKDARLGGDAQRTRFVTVLSKEVNFGIRTLADPYRVIVDLSDVKLNFPTGRGKESHGLVTGYRYGRVEPYGVRIILDVSGPVLVEKAAIWPAGNGQPPRLVVELTRTDRATFMAKQRAISKRLAARRSNNNTNGDLPLKRRKSRSSKKVVVIDPGHGGIDPGAVSESGLKEKDIVFEFAKVLRAKLAKTGRYEAILTRTKDSYIPLRKRVSIARTKGADLFISLHADALPGRYASSVEGATVYTLSEEASDEEAKALAAKENRSDIIAGVELPVQSDDVRNILIDLAQRETKNLSVSFADALLAGLSGQTKISKKGRRFAGFVVLKAPDVPSVLLELGYMTHPKDVKRLKSSAWRARVADAVTSAIDTYFARQTARNPF